MNLFSWFTSGSKTVDNVMDKDKGLIAKAGGFIDRLSYTDEEKAEANGALTKGVIDYAIASMGENSERSKARRMIATLWIKSQLGLVLMCAIAAPWNMSLAEFYFRLATSSLMITVTSAISIFFFGSYMLTRHNDTKK